MVGPALLAMGGAAAAFLLWQRYRRRGQTTDSASGGPALHERPAEVSRADEAGHGAAARSKLSRLATALGELNRACAQAHSAEEVERSVCRVLVNSGLFKLVWVGWQDTSAKMVVPTAMAGEDAARLVETTTGGSEPSDSRGLTGLAIANEQARVENDLLNPASPLTGGAAATSAGLRACIALPLRAGGKTGALTAYAAQTGFFGAEEVGLLELAAGAISLSLEKVERTRSAGPADARSLLLGAALEEAPNGVVITDRHGLVEWANPAFARASGYTLDELLGKSLRLLKSGHHPPEYYAELWRTILGGAIWHGEMLNRRKNGELYIEDVTILPARDAAGQIERFVSLRQDITGRKGAERRIREQAALLDQASDAIVVVDLTHRVTFWNRAAERLFGRTARETLGQPLTKAFALEDAAASPHFHQALAVPQDWRGEIRTRNRENQMLVLDTSITMLRDDHGQLTGRLCISADATRKKELEEQFLRVQRMENLGMLAAGISHDLNNILAPMRMIGPLLRDRLSEPRDLRLLDTLESCAARGAGLVRQILGFAQGIAGEHRVVQVKHLLRDITEVIGATFPKSIVLEDEIPADLWPVNGNPTQIHQVVLNLCVNARDAMPHGGTLRLRAMNCLLDEAAARPLEGARPGAWIVLHVEDTGTGIPADVLPRIWEPLFTTKTPDKGTGLGLSTVRGIVAQHEGFVTLQTEVGRGTTFRVYLPVEEAAAGTTGTVSPFAVKPARGELVMFVDDEPSICELATVVLSRQGYRVITARDGAEAVAQFAPRIAEIALIITDLDMPTLDGTALCRVIHALSPQTKIMATSGFAQAAPAGEAFDAFIPKPFMPETLLRAVEQLLHPTTGR